MDRYLTRYSAAITQAEAERLADLDGTPRTQIKYTANVEIVHIHRTFDWALWLDGKLTIANSLPFSLNITKLSDDAVQLITVANESDPGYPSCGWQALAKIKQIYQKNLLAVGPARGIYQPETLEQLTVEYQDGSFGPLWLFSVGSSGGYRCEIYNLETFPLQRLQTAANPMSLKSNCSFLQLITL